MLRSSERKVLMAIAILGMIAVIAWANTGVVKKVLGGDIVQIGDDFIARLTGLRAPRLGEPLGREVYEFTLKELEGQLVRLATWTTDNTAAGIVYDEQGLPFVLIHYGRFSRDKGFEACFNEVLLKKGYARVDRKYLPNDLRHFLDLEKEAREKGLGIWNTPSGASETGPNRPGPASAPETGYSIFEETMVDMAWPEVEKSARSGSPVLMTTAVIEEHGPHMSCGTDTYFGQLLCKLVRRELAAKGVKAVVAPPFFWGVNSATHVFPGSFGIRPETAKALLGDIFASFKTMGFRRVFIINAHGDGQHKRAVIQAILEAEKSTGLDIRYLVSASDVRQLGLTGEPPSWVLLHEMPPDEGPRTAALDIHAGAGETGLMAAYFPDLVDERLARTLPPTKLTGAQIGEWLKDARKATPLGYVGNPAGYDTKEALAYVPAWVRMMAEAISDHLARAK